MKTVYYISFLLLFQSIGLIAQNNFHLKNAELSKRLKETPGLVALWDFKEKEGHARKVYGMGTFPLKEENGTLTRIQEGPISGYSAKFGNKAFLTLENAKTGELNIFGNNQGVTVIAWVKWEGNTGFVGGMWNEYQDGGKRQYGLFVSLPHYNGADQVCGHISKTGKPTPPFPFSIDYSASKQVVAKNQWQCIAFTYDGEYIKSFLNGEFLEREKELINHTKGFEGFPDGLAQSKNPYYFTDGIGNNGSDFTVGAVLLKSGMGNFFNGLIGGLAVFNRALSDDEIDGLSF
jgi:hypothetical protein